jgi:hypothetical protein
VEPASKTLLAAGAVRVTELAMTNCKAAVSDKMIAEVLNIIMKGMSLLNDREWIGVGKEDKEEKSYRKEKVFFNPSFFSLFHEKKKDNEEYNKFGDTCVFEHDFPLFILN